MQKATSRKTGGLCVKLDQKSAMLRLYRAFAGDGALRLLKAARDF